MFRAQAGSPRAAEHLASRLLSKRPELRPADAGLRAGEILVDRQGRAEVP